MSADIEKDFIEYIEDAITCMKVDLSKAKSTAKAPPFIIFGEKVDDEIETTFIGVDPNYLFDAVQIEKFIERIKSNIIERNPYFVIISIDGKSAKRSTYMEDVDLTPEETKEDTILVFGFHSILDDKLYTLDLDRSGKGIQVKSVTNKLLKDTDEKLYIFDTIGSLLKKINFVNS